VSENFENRVRVACNVWNAFASEVDVNKHREAIEAIATILFRDLPSLRAENERLRQVLTKVLELYPQTFKCAYGANEYAHIDPHDWKEVQAEMEALLHPASPDKKGEPNP
jgi:hypothetical protein